MKYVAQYASISVDERFADLKDDAAARFFLMLRPHCDSWGRITARARRLNGIVWPLLQRSVDETQAALDACLAAGVLELHELDGERWLQIPADDWEETSGRSTAPSKRGESEFPTPTTGSRVGSAPSVSEHSEQPGALRASQSAPPISEDRRVETLQSLPLGGLEQDRSARGRTRAPSRGRRTTPTAELRAHAPPAIPRSLATPTVRRELDAYLARRARDRRRVLGPAALERLWARLEPHGPRLAAIALATAAERGYPGCWVAPWMAHAPARSAPPPPRAVQLELWAPGAAPPSRPPAGTLWSLFQDARRAIAAGPKRPPIVQHVLWSNGPALADSPLRLVATTPSSAPLALRREA